MALTDVVASKVRQKVLVTLMAEALDPPLTKPQMKAILDSIDDWWESKRVELFNAMKTASGRSDLTVNLAKKFGKYWMEQKWGGE